MTSSTSTDGDVARARAIRDKYEDLFWRQPYVHGTGIGYIRDASGEPTDRVGFVISVSIKVDQDTLPPGDRIPDSLEGVPVQILEVPEPTLVGNRRIDSERGETHGSS